MMEQPEQFPYQELDSAIGPSSRMPYLPIELRLGTRETPVSGLLDSGATVNVLPYSVGTQLGAIWEEQEVPVRLAGNLARFEARMLLLMASVGRFRPVRLAFAWSRSNELPVILGQVNFFSQFDICFFRKRDLIELRPSTA